MKKLLFIVILITCCNKNSFGQSDPHFSQYYAFPLWLNPGMVGVMDGDYRVTGIYRNQWNNVMMPFSTMGFSADMATSKNINLGVDMMNQSAGDGGYRYTTASVTVGYSIRFGPDKKQLFTMGIRPGLLNRRFDPSKFQYGDQWNPVTGFDPTTASIDALSKTGSSSFDMGSGISYFDARSGRVVNIFAGGALFHLTRPEDPFINNSLHERLPTRLSLHGGARINLSERAGITPHFQYMQQGNATEKMVGLFGQYNAAEGTDVMAGVNYRFKDAISPFIGVSFRNFVLGASYDINNSELGKAVPGTNSMEISLSYMVRKDRESLRYLSCPRF